MNVSTRTQFISALVVAAAWACSSEPTDNTGMMATGGTTGPAAGAANSAGAVNGVSGATGTAGSGQGGAGPTGGVAGSGGAAPTGGAAPMAGTGGAAPMAGTGGAAPGGAGGAAPGGAGGGGPTTCDNLPGVQGHPDCAATYPTYPGFTLALVEEFTAPIDLVNDPIWTYSDGHPDGPVRFVKEGIGFDTTNGYMTLTMTDTPVAGSQSYAEEYDVTDRAYSSGEMRTKYNNYRYGRYEVRFKSPMNQPGDPNATGGFVATMFVFRNPKFTNWREIDLEQTGDNANAMATNLINGENKQAWGADFADPGSHPIAFNAREDFHEYAFEWTSESVTWFADGQQIRQQVGAAKLPIPEMSTKIMMNLWWGSFGGDGSGNGWPLVTEYDWIRFYKWDNEPMYPCSPTPDCLPQTDLDGAKNNAEDGITYIPPNQGN